MIWGFINKQDSSFISEDTAQDLPVEVFYSARLDGGDRNEIREVFCADEKNHPQRKTHSSGEIERFLDLLNEHSSLSSLAILHYATPGLVQEWTKINRKVLEEYRLENLIKSPGGRRSVGVFLQEEKNVQPEELSKILKTASRSPKKIKRLLNKPRPRGRPKKTLEDRLVCDSLAALVVSYRQTFNRDPVISSWEGSISPILQIAEYFLKKVNVNLSYSRLSDLFGNALPVTPPKYS